MLYVRVLECSVAITYFYLNIVNINDMTAYQIYNVIIIPSNADGKRKPLKVRTAENGNQLQNCEKQRDESERKEKIKAKI